MDQIVAQALTVYAKIKGARRALATAAGASSSYAHSANGNGNGHHRLGPKELVLPTP
jgi:hypothetical protein